MFNNIIIKLDGLSTSIHIITKTNWIWKIINRKRVNIQENKKI